MTDPKSSTPQPTPIVQSLLEALEGSEEGVPHFRDLGFIAALFAAANDAEQKKDMIREVISFAYFLVERHRGDDAAGQLMSALDDMLPAVARARGLGATAEQPGREPHPAGPQCPSGGRPARAALRRPATASQLREIPVS